MRSSCFSHDVHAFFAGHLDALEADDSPAFVWYVYLIETLLAFRQVRDLGVEVGAKGDQTVLAS